MHQGSFVLSVWVGTARQGETVRYARGGVRRYDWPRATVYRFTAHYACLSVQAGAMGAAIDLARPGIYPVNGPLFDEDCAVARAPSVSAIRFVQGLGPYRRYRTR